MSSIRAVRSFIALMVRDVIVVPVRDGTLQLRNHPPVIAGVTWVVTGVIGILIAGIVFANPLRRSSEMTGMVDESGASIVPKFLVPAILFVLALAIALVLAGSQRMRLWLRILLFLVCTGILGDLISSSTVVGASSAWIIWTVFAVLVAYCMLIWTRRTQLATDFFILLALTMLITVLSYRRFVDGNALMDAPFDLVTTATLIITLTSLAMPAAFMSGLSATKLGVSLGVAAGAFAARRISVRVASLILVGIIAYQIIAVTPAFIERWKVLGPLPAVGSTAGGFGFISVCLLAWWLAHRVSGGWSVLERDVADIASAAALPIAYVLMAPLLISNVIALFGATVTLGGSADAQSRVIAAVQAFGSETAASAARVVVTVVLVATGGWMMVRRRPRAAAILLIDAIFFAAVLFAVSPMRAAHLSWSVGDLGDVGLIVGTVLFAFWSSRRTLTPDRLVLVYIIVLLSALIRRADYFDLPFGFLLGGSTIALLLIGLVWGFLTGGGGVHEDKPHYPRDGRLLLFLGTFLFSIAMLAWSTVGKQVELARELSAESALGLVTLGSAYVLVCVLDSAHSWRRANQFRGNLETSTAVS